MFSPYLPARILLHIQRQQNACGGRFRRGRQNMQWWQSGLAVSYRCRTIQSAGYVPVQTFQGCHYIRRGFLPHSRPRAAFLKSAMTPPCCQSQPFFINQAGGISEQCWYFGWLQLRFTLTTIWYSVDVSVHDTNKRCSHYASCLSRSSWNSQLCGIVRWQPIFIAQASTLHRKTYISPVSRSEVWRNDWIVVISPVTTSTRSLVS